MSGIRQQRALFRAMTSSAVRAAARPSGGFYAGLAMLSAFVSAGNGLRAADVMRAMDALPAVRIGLWAAWIIAALPVARAVLEAPGLAFLRALPIAPWRLVFVQATHLAIAELPWILLFVRGTSVPAGLGAGGLAMALHALLAAGLSRTSTRGRALAGPPTWALVRVLLRILRRSRQPAMLRGLLFVLSVAGVALLAIRNNAVTNPAEIGSISLGGTIVAAALATGALAPATHEAARAQTALLAWTGVPPRTLSRAAAASLAAIGALAGTMLAMAISAALRDPLLAVRLVPTDALGGAGIGVVASDVARRFPFDTGPFFERMARVTVPLAFVPAVFGESSLLLVLLVAASALWRGERS